MPQYEDKLKSKTDHFWLPSVAQKRRVLKFPNDHLFSGVASTSFPGSFPSLAQRPS